VREHGGADGGEGRREEGLFAFGVDATPLLGPLPTPVSWGEEGKKRSLEIFVEKARTFAIVVRIRRAQKRDFY